MRGLVRTRSGEPRPGVLVSDGRSVTTTAADGSWSLDPLGPFVFVVRPAGFACEPWFVRPAGSHDFVLDPVPDVFPHRFVHVSDTHLGAGPRYASLYPQPVEIGTGDVLTRFLTRLPELVPDVAAVVATGDLTDLGIDEEFAALRAARDASPVPLHLLPGNHDHMNGVVEGALSRNGYALHTADPAGYERNIGPRWYSYDLPGLHVVALDWHTHELGIDHEAQDAWIRADLESVPAGTPWILLSHDQPWHSILDGLPAQPLATFSGHRHTSRVVEVNGTLHVNTPTSLFGALDFSPPSFREVTWDGSAIRLRTRTLAGTTATFTVPPLPVPRPAVARWRHQLAGAVHRAAPRVHGDTVLCAVKDEDRAAGAVEALDLATGTPRWRTALRSSVKGTPVVHDDTVIAVEVSGDTVGLDLAAGTERWRAPSPDPLRLFAFADPVLAGDAVVVGDLSHLRALDAETGALRWERTDLSPYQTIVAHAAPVLAGDVLVVGSWPAPQSLVGLDPATGATRWPGETAAGDLPGLGSDITAGDTTIGTPRRDPKTGDLFVSGLGFLARIDAATGATVWRRPASLPWNPATPAVTDLGIAAVDAGHGVVLLDRDGGLVWETRIEGDSPFAMSSYRRTPHPLFAGPTPLDDALLVPGLDGALHVLDGATGALRRSVPLGTPVAAPAVVAGETVLLVGVDGGVLALDAAGLR
ncbi:outer membrane protein assembly factor BamB family protein [Pseudonocardia pini]|uniref:outer membrane protein assembly factor BamB family protein n=1 Tax=Pseudonocardia pini TaxID=2758030 RepID=UPI0015F053A1|nr:PQQ-binding-like beta-propeller repeat protein [Pseudonocardia pini]